MTPSDIEKSRKEFDEWYEKTFNDEFLKSENRYQHNQRLWGAWQASRESLFVELPERNNNEYRPEFSRGFNTCLNKSILAIASAGINYRERE